MNQQDIDDYFAHTDQSAMGANKANTKPGDIRYQDISGPDGVPDGKVDATYDRVYLGSKIPKYTFGLSLNAAYKGFDLNIFLQGVSGVNGKLSGFPAGLYGAKETYRNGKWKKHSIRRILHVTRNIRVWQIWEMQPVSIHKNLISGYVTPLTCV